MKLKMTNIEEELEKLRGDEKEADKILKAVRAILEKESHDKANILQNLTGGSSVTTNAFNFDLLESDKIYHIDQIKKICIDYRLRFLNSKYFKGEIPEEAFFKIEQLEKQHEIELKGFKIMAPSKLFKLADKDDPLLFAPIGNNYFYLIHKWGNDLHPLRKLMVLPFKNIVNLAILVFFISCLCTAMVPDGLFSKSGSNSEKMVVLFFMFKCIASVVIFYGFALGKNFNPAIWNSKYFNA